MKIIEQTTDVLIAKENNYSFFFLPPILLIVGIIFKVGTGAGSSLPSWVGYLIMLSSVISILLWKRVTLQVDKAAHQLTVEAKWLITTRRRTFDTSQVQSLQLQASVSTNHSSHGNTQETVYSLMLMMKDGTMVDLSDANSTNGSIFSFFRKMPNHDIGQTIANFLGVPFQEMTPNTAVQMFSSIAQSIIQKGSGESMVANSVPSPVPPPTSPTVTSPPQTTTAPPVAPSQEKPLEQPQL